MAKPQVILYYGLISVLIVGSFFGGFFAGLFTETPSTSMVSAQSVSIPLINPSFEGSFPEYDGTGELKVGTGWAPGWLGRRPEYLGHPTSNLTNPDGSVPIPGSWSQKMFVTYSTLDGWIRQDIDVVPHSWVRVTAWMYMRSQDNSGDVSAMVCVNPWGNWDANDRTTICGEEVAGVYDRWFQVEVIAPTFGDRITIFLRGVAKWAVRWNDLYFDQVEASYWTWGDCPTPVPTVTIVPTATVRPTVTIVPTMVPGECATLSEIEQLLRGMKWGVQ